MTLLDISEFRRLAREGAAPRGGITALSARSIGSLTGRIVRFVFSDGSIDRMGDTIDPSGWETDAYLKNPVVLWAHDALAPPIGRTVNLFTDGRGLVGDIEFAKAEEYAFADTIFRLVSAKFLNAGSVGFLPIKYSLSKDKDRPGGIDFHRQELLEFSMCPVPANANALLVQAQANRTISAREATMLRTKSVQRRRAARLSKLAPSPSRRAPSRLPSRAVLLQRFAGTLASRDRQVDLAYPGLAAQELADVRATADTNTEAGRRALIDALAEFEQRKVRNG